jgi:hypothetical protein
MGNVPLKKKALTLLRRGGKRTEKSKFIGKYFLKIIVIYSKSEEGNAFVHANCEAKLTGRCNSSERKRPYSRMLYLFFFDTSLESESVTLYSKF